MQLWGRRKACPWISWLKPGRSANLLVHKGSQTKYKAKVMGAILQKGTRVIWLCDSWKPISIGFLKICLRSSALFLIASKRHCCLRRRRSHGSAIGGRRGQMRRESLNMAMLTSPNCRSGDLWPFFENAPPPQQIAVWASEQDGKSQSWAWNLRAFYAKSGGGQQVQL